MKVRFVKKENVSPNDIECYKRNRLVNELGFFVRYLSKDENGETKCPIYFEENGNWIDLMCVENVNLAAGESCLIHLGLAMKIPHGYEGHLLPRSSTFKRYGIMMTNSMGIIDTNYCGNNDEWMMSVIATRNIFIPKYTRIAQFKIVPTMETIFFNRLDRITCNSVFPPDSLFMTFIECDDLETEDRGGFGSTGI